VATVTWTTDQVMRRLFPERAVTEWSDPSGTVTMVERGLPAEWAGRSLGDLTVGNRFRLVTVTRSGQARIASPDLVGQEGDILMMVVHRDAVADLDRLLSSSSDVGGHH